MLNKWNGMEYMNIDTLACVERLSVLYRECLCKTKKNIGYKY
jgi:hypothetical protein